MIRIVPLIVIDAAAHFQNHGEPSHRLVESAIECGAHYMDLSDDADFALSMAKFDCPAREE